MDTVIDKVEQARTVEHLDNPLPRSVTRGTPYVLLDGEWRFAPDLEDRGLTERWYLAHNWEYHARWPGSVEAHLDAITELQQQSETRRDRVVAWYEREFRVPDSCCDSVDTLP